MGRKFDVCGTGWVACNKKRWKDARLVIFRPGFGMAAIEFGESDRTSFTVVAREFRCSAMCEIGSDMADGSSYSGIAFWEDCRHELKFKKRDWPHGDIREMVEPALNEIKWRYLPSRYYLVGKYGDFWDRPLPKDCPSKPAAGCDRKDNPHDYFDRSITRQGDCNP